MEPHNELTYSTLSPPRVSRFAVTAFLLSLAPLLLTVAAGAAVLHVRRHPTPGLAGIGDLIILAGAPFVVLVYGSAAAAVTLGLGIWAQLRIQSRRHALRGAGLAARAWRLSATFHVQARCTVAGARHAAGGRDLLGNWVSWASGSPPPAR
jgi:hypothetical protein